MTSADKRGPIADEESLLQVASTAAACAGLSCALINFFFFFAVTQFFQEPNTAIYVTREKSWPESTCALC